MVVPFDLTRYTTGERRASATRHRVKASSLTLGATRFRLLWVLRNLGFARDRIEAVRLRDEADRQRIIEERRLDRLREAEAMRAWLEDEERLRLIEERKAALLIREKLRYESMTEQEKAVVHQEEEIVSWLTVDEIGD